MRGVWGHRHGDNSVTGHLGMWHSALTWRQQGDQYLCENTCSICSLVFSSSGVTSLWNKQKANTHCGGGWNSVSGNNWCHSCCSYWCDRTEDGLLWGTKNKSKYFSHCIKWLFIIFVGSHQEAVTCVMVCGGWGFWAPIAGWDGSVIRVAVSRDVWDLWILTVAGGGWMVSPGRLKEKKIMSL